MAVELAYRPVVLELATPLATAHGPFERRASWVVRATLASGEGAPGARSAAHGAGAGDEPAATARADAAVGFGEAAPLPGFGGGDPERVVGALAAIARGWARSAWHGSPEELERMEQSWASELPADTAARSGAAFALADLAARGKGLPLAAWLAWAEARVSTGARGGGDTARQKENEPPVGEPALPRLDGAGPTTGIVPSVLVNGVIGALSPEAAGTEAVRLVELGHATLKVKVGGDPEDDAARVRAVRAAAGAGVRVRVDANEGWTWEQAMRAIEKLSACDVEYVEQPVSRSDIDGMARLRHRGAVAIAADEAMLEAGGPEAVASAGAADVWVLKPALLGGPLRTLALARRAAELGVRCVVTTAVEGGVGRLGALHVAATIAGRGWDGGLAHGLGTGGFLLHDLVATPGPEEGCIAVPTAPGLGCEGPEGPWTGLAGEGPAGTWASHGAPAALW